MSVTAEDSETKTMNGEFVWNNKDKNGEVEAIFTATGSETTFQFSGKVADGAFTGTHLRIDDEGNEHDTGTLTMK